MPRTAATLLALPLAVLAPGACGEPDAAGAASTAGAASAWPAGTVLAVDEVPVTVDEVDAASVWIELIDPKASGPQLRRLALTNVSLPRAIAEAMAPEERARALGEARAALERLRAGTWEGPAGEVVEGNWQELSIPAWGTALALAPGEWSEPVDDIGRFLLIRLVRREDLPHSAALRVEIEVHAFRYLPLEVDVETAKDDHRLTIVDPAWREIVPELTQYRMGAHRP